jgi:putative endonuclease
MYFVYVLQSDKDKRFYTGLTQDLKKRIDEHNAGASKATKARIPLKHVYYESCMNYKDATKRERYLKTTWGKRYIKNRIKNYLEENGIFT